MRFLSLLNLSTIEVEEKGAMVALDARVVVREVQGVTVHMGGLQDDGFPSLCKDLEG